MHGSPNVSEVMMSFHQVLAILSSVCFVVGGMLVGIGLSFAAMKHAREHVEKIGPLEVVRQDAVA